MTGQTGAVGGEHADPHWMASVFAVWNLIIRPPRHRYSRMDLLQDFPVGRFRLLGQTGVREDLHIQNPRGIELACTVLEPAEAMGDGSSTERACVVYCHGNGSCRLAGFKLAKVLLPLGVGLVCFDFAGSGMSGGEYVSLGHYEKDDLSCVIEYLREKRGYSRIGLWGFSMGAATVLMHAARDPSIAGLVADSPFCDLWQLIEEVCFHFVRIPAILLAPVLQMVRMMIQQKANFDICDVSPQAHVANCFVPAMFLHGDKDEFVKPHHTEKMREMYCGEASRLCMPEQTHATIRKERFLARAVVFMIRALRWESFLPEGIGQEAFAELEKGRILGFAGTREEMLPMPRETADLITKLLRSQERESVCSGLLQAAMALCGAYQGAELLPCGFPVADAAGGGSPSSHREGSEFARFFGKVTFSAGDVDLGLCWVRSGCASPAGGEVECAVISTTVASLSSVQLSRGKGAGGDGDLHCAGVESKDFATLSLQTGRSYDVALFVEASGRVVLEVDGQAVVRSEATGSTPQDAGIHLWVLQWKEQNAGWFGGSSAKVELSLGSEPGRHLSSPEQAEASEPEQFAKTLATLCLGPPVLSPKSRAALRSGVFTFAPESSLEGSGELH